MLVRAGELFFDLSGNFCCLVWTGYKSERASVVPGPLNHAAADAVMTCSSCADTVVSRHDREFTAYESWLYEQFNVVAKDLIFILFGR